MSPLTAFIRYRRDRKSKRYRVAYYATTDDGRQEVSIGAVETRKDAVTLKRWADSELASGRRPDIKARLAPPEKLKDVAERYERTIGKKGEARRKTTKQAVARLGKLGRKGPADISAADVQEWIVANDNLAPSSLRAYLGVIAKILDVAEVEPNPARSRVLEFPEPPNERKADPPSYAEFTALLERMGPKQVPAVAILEGTGLRIGELEALTWGDIDWRGKRVRVARTKGKTAGLRFVPLLPRVEMVLESLAEHEDRVGDQPVIPDVTNNAVYKAMMRGCKAKGPNDEGLRRFSPHDLRDRFISLMGLAGIPLPLIRDIAGHTKNTVTLDIYTHVLLDEPDWRLDELRRAVGRMTGLDSGVSEREREEV